MSRERTPMRKIREILQHRYTHGFSFDKTGLALKKSKGVVFNTCTRFQASGLPWPLPVDMTDSQLEEALYPSKDPLLQDAAAIPLPDISYIERELARKHVTIQLLYREYKQQYPDCMSQAQFYRFVKSGRPLSVTMHLEHKGGDTLFCDYSGDGLEWIDECTGEIHSVQLFVSALAASSLTYAEATPTQQEEHFTMSHVRAFAYYGGVTASIVPDNLKSGVTKVDRYDPGINLLFSQFAAHYGTVILPARVRKPRDKAAVESAVLVAQRDIIAALRNHVFYSIAQINAAIREQIEMINNRPMKDHGGLSRRQRFVERDQPYLKPLPKDEFKISVVKHNVSVGIDYHIQFENRFYSVPFKYAKQKVDVHLNGMTVEIYSNGVHCCRHALGPRNYGYSTSTDHMPPNHAFVKGMRPEWFIAKARDVGPSVAAVVETMILKNDHPQQGFRFAQGLITLAKAYPAARMEKACARALQFKSTRLADVKSILAQNLDAQQTIVFPTPTPIIHDNMRGPEYYVSPQ